MAVSKLESWESTVVNATLFNRLDGLTWNYSKSCQFLKEKPGAGPTFLVLDFHARMSTTSSFRDIKRKEILEPNCFAQAPLRLS